MVLVEVLRVLIIVYLGVSIEILLNEFNVLLWLVDIWVTLMLMNCVRAVFLTVNFVISFM